jgi:hypothetical protein
LEDTKVSRLAVLAAVFLVAMLGFTLYPNAYAWNSSPQITYSQDSSSNIILTIQFNFAQMSDPPTSSHYPTQFQVRTSTDGSSWTELTPVPISPTPTTTIFKETYNLGSVSGMIQVQARLECNIHGWSNWGPDPATPVPEFPSTVIPIILALVFAGVLFLFRRKNRPLSL